MSYTTSTCALCEYKLPKRPPRFFLSGPNGVKSNRIYLCSAVCKRSLRNALKAEVKKGITHEFIENRVVKREPEGGKT